MARGLNNVTLAGTLVSKEMRYTPGGLAILDLNLAGNDHVTGDDGKERELAWYHRATVFGKFAEAIVDDLEDGTPMFVQGRINYSSWETNEGQRRSALDVRADRAEVMNFGTRKGETTVTDVRGQHRLRDAINHTMLIGNLTRDAELRYTPSGAAVTRFSIAVNERYRTRDGEDKESTHFVEINVWRELAEACANLLKGDPVFVTGRLVNDNWTDRDGNKRYVTRIEGDRVEFLTRRDGRVVGANPHESAPAQPTSGPQNPAPERTSPPPTKLDIDQEFPPEDDLPF